MFRKIVALGVLLVMIGGGIYISTLSNGTDPDMFVLGQLLKEIALRVAQ